MASTWAPESRRALPEAELDPSPPKPPPSPPNAPPLDGNAPPSDDQPSWPVPEGAAPSPPNDADEDSEPSPPNGVDELVLPSSPKGDEELELPSEAKGGPEQEPEALSPSDVPVEVPVADGLSPLNVALGNELEAAAVPIVPPARSEEYEPSDESEPLVEPLLAAMWVEDSGNDAAVLSDPDGEPCDGSDVELPPPKPPDVVELEPDPPSPLNVPLPEP